MFNSFSNSNNSTFNKPSTGGIFGGGGGGGAAGSSVGSLLNTAANGIFGQNQPQQTQPFGGNTAASTGGIFGNQTAPSSGGGGGIFGAQTANTNASTFGANTNTGGVFGSTNTQSNSAFGGSNAGGIFGGNQNSTQPAQSNGGIFGNTQPQQGNSPFGGNNAAQNTGGGIFGNTGGTTGGVGNVSGGGIFNQGATQNTSAGIFGNNTQNQPSVGGGIFGGNQNTAQTTQNAGGIFGNSGSSNQTSSVFGGPSTNNSPFNAGQNTSSIGGGTTGIFGSSQQNNSSPFGGATNPAQSGGIFGASNTSSSPFSSASQNTNNSFLGDSTQQQPSSSPFSSFGNTALQTQPSFGNPAANNNAGNAKFGNTTWGVPTSQPATNQAMAPVKSKNVKLDGKHMVKCISALDQYQGLCKEEVRVNFIMTGGQQQPIQQQPLQQQQANNSSILSPNKSGIFGGAGSTQNNGTGIFSGANNNASISSFGASNNLGANNGTGLFGAANTNSTGGGSILTNPSNLNTSSLLSGASNYAQKPLFGASQTATTTPNTGIFGASGGGSLFPSGQQASNPYNTQQPQQNQGVFNQPTSGLMSNQTPQPSSGGLFAPSTGSGIFGDTTTPQPTTGIFGAIGQKDNQSGIFGNTQQTTSPLFGAQTTAQPYGQPSGQPYASSLYKQQPPQNLFGPAPQYMNNQANPEMQKIIDLLTKIGNQGEITQAKVRDSLKVTPFDDILAEAKRENVQENRQKSLFTNDDYEPYFNDYESTLDKIYRQQHEAQRKIKPRFIEPPQSKKPIFDEEELRQIKSSLRKSKAEITKKVLCKEHELPSIGDFTIKPSLKELLRLTPQDLKNVPNVVISNSFGSIRFLEPINLYKKDLQQSLEIGQDNLQILEEEWEDKQAKVTFFNFGNFSTLDKEDKNKLTRRMSKWIEKCDMKLLRHDTQNGDLCVEINN